MHLVVIGWLYVALMMAVAEATNSTGTVLGAIITFLLYGLLPVALVVYLMSTPARRRRQRERENAEREAAIRAAAEAAAAVPTADPRAATASATPSYSGAPDARSETPADPVAPMGEKP